MEAPAQSMIRLSREVRFPRKPSVRPRIARGKSGPKISNQNRIGSRV